MEWILTSEIKGLINRLYLILFLVTSIGLANGVDSTKDYFHINFTTEDGLPSNEVYCVFQDSKGFIWIGTDRGVVKYDGYKFKSFTTEDGLTDNVIFDIAEDSKGQIWFTTSNRTLCFYNLLGEFKPFIRNSLIKETVYKSDTYYNLMFDDIFIDKRDHIFISNLHYGYLEIDLSKQSLIKNNLISYNETMQLDKQIEVVKDFDYHQITLGGCIHMNQVHNPHSAYYKLNINKNTISNIPINYIKSRIRAHVLNDTVYSIGNTIYTIHKDSVSTKEYTDGMYIYKVGDDFLVNKVKDNSKGEVFLVKDIHNIETTQIKLLNKSIRLTRSIQDNNGGYWLGSLEYGIFYIPSLNNRMIHQNSNVSSIIPYNNGIQFIERNNEYSYYDFESGHIEQSQYLNVTQLKSYVDHSIKLLHPIEIDQVSQLMDETKTVSSKLISALFINKDSLIFARTSRFIYYNSKEKRLDVLMVFNKRIVAIESMGKNQFLIACNDGIYKYSLSSVVELDGIIHYHESKPDIPIQGKIQDIKWFNKRKILAIGTTGNGILFYKNDELLKKIVFKDGLVSNSVNQLFLDEQDRLWVATNKGINYIEIDNNDSIYVKNYLASSRSLPSPNVQQLFVIQDSLLFVGTDKGLNEFNISGLNKVQKRYFPLGITKSVVNKSFPIRSELTYNENNLEFYYTAIEFNRFGDINYRYRLIGLSNQWIYTKERKATFLQVSPGDYQFELEAQNEKGEWVRAKDQVSFTIQKPYWKTWWFIGGITITIILIVGGALYYYISNLQKEKEFIEDKQVLSEELNETRQKALSAQLNPHFVFNSLNSIQNFILTKRTELSSDYLSMFSKLMRFVFENSKKLYVPLSDEIEALRLYLELEQVRHNHKFEYQVSSKNLKTKDVFIPSLLVQPMIENAIWHGLLHKQEDNRLLEVNFSSEDQYLKIEVRDNGVGRSGSTPRPKFIKKQRSSGVELTKQRLDLLRQSTGLKTTFEIVDLYDEKNSPLGTLVILMIPIYLKP